MMDQPISPARGPLRGPFPVPPSKSQHQRCLALGALADAPAEIRTLATRAPGEDVRFLEAAVGQLGRWQEGALGAGRDSLRLHLGEGATGYRYATALSMLRPAGARTLVTGRPRLQRRDHGALLRALRALGGHVRRRHSGSIRVVAGGLAGGRVDIDASVTSQFASTLLLIAPRIGGIDLRLLGRPASTPYVRVTLDVLSRFGVAWEARELGRTGGRIEVEGGAPRADRVLVEPDASCAAAWWSAVALCGGEAVVPGIRPDSEQADLALTGLLARMGAQVDTDPSGAVRVLASGAGLASPGAVDLRAAPDLVFLMGVLAARAEGETILTGVAATRGKESDRVAVLARGLEALGARVRLEGADCVRIRGGGLHGGRVAVGGDHRAAFAFGVLGLAVPGVVLTGAERAVGKSHPGFLDDLAVLAGEDSGLA